MPPLDFREAVQRFDDLQREVFALRYAQQVIEFDGETVAPVKGVEARAEALATLSLREHELSYGSAAGEILAALEGFRSELDEIHLHEFDFYLRDYQRMSVIPPQLLADFSRLTEIATSVWKRAKETDDYALFAPYLERIVGSLEEQATYIDPSCDVYETLVDGFEPGLTLKTLDDFFSVIQTCLPDLVLQAAECSRGIDSSYLHVMVPAATQDLLCRDVAAAMGLDMDALAIGQTEHPFTDGFCHGDVRIANHYHPDDLMSAVFSMVHEGGHALYEQGVDPHFDYTCLRGGVSMGIHESQSRFMENVIARSEEFCSLLLPILRRHVPGVFDTVTGGDLCRSVSAVRPSLIRTEADEVTYPFHILVRYRTERALFNGAISVSEAPSFWNSMMADVLGTTVPDDRMGILQDCHWAGGTFGYFPSYAVGSAYAAQFLGAMQREFDVYAAVETGDLSLIRAWLHDHVWIYGCSKTPEAIVKDSCGSGLDPQVYITYLNDKYTRLFHL